MVQKKKSWVEKLHDNKGLPKVEIINEKIVKDGVQEPLLFRHQPKLMPL